MKKIFLLIAIAAVVAFAIYLYSRQEPVVTTPRIASQWFSKSDKPLIVFVHGLGGDPYDTWGKDGNSFMEILQRDGAFSEFTVISVSYPTSLLKRDVSFAQLATSFAAWLDDNFKTNKEIVIIAHSLGGVIARQGLVQSNFKNRSDQLVTLIALASPFDGSQLPDFAKILDVFKVSSRQLGALGIRSDVLQLCENGWLDLVKNHGSRIRQFAASEAKPTRGIVVVSEASATQNIERDCTFRSVSDDHLSIAKPDSLDGGVGKQVRDWILHRRYKRGRYAIGYELQIPPAGSLTIEPGTEITFQKAKLTVKGKIQAKGTEHDRIKFEYESTPESDAGIVLRGDAVAGSLFDYCTFQKGDGIGVRKPGPETMRKLRREETWGEKRTTMVSSEVRFGGAVALIGASDVTFSNSEFIENEAYQGGAIALFGCIKIRINRSRFLRNMSAFGGGAVFAQASDFDIGSGCLFDQNTTGQVVPSYRTVANSQFACGGAVYLGYLARCTIQGSVFNQNKASHAGGAIYIRDTHPAGFESAPKVDLLDITFNGNESGSDGAGLCIEAKSQGNVSKPLFDNNTAGSDPEKVGLAFVDRSELGFAVSHPLWRRNGEEYVEEYRAP